MDRTPIELICEKNQNFLEGQRILVIEDDPETQQLLKHIYLRAGGEVIQADDGQSGVRKFYDQGPDLVVLDIMMPGMDGYDVCQRIRRKSNVPIIMLTALTQENDVIHGLDAGADDFISKPVTQSVLISRSKAALRSSIRHRLQGEETINYSDGYLTIMLGKRRIWVYGKPLKLTPKEFDMLAHLFRYSGHTTTTDEILVQAWGWDDQDREEDVPVVFSRLQKKIELDPEHPRYLRSRGGNEYAFLGAEVVWLPGRKPDL